MTSTENLESEVLDERETEKPGFFRGSGLMSAFFFSTTLYMSLDGGLGGV